MRRSALILAGAAAFVLGAAGCGGNRGDRTFDERGFGITFTYPSAFKKTDKVSFSRSAGGASVARAAVALDRDNAIVVTRYALRASVTKDNLARFKPEVDGVVGQLAGKPVSGRRVAYGGLPGYEYSIAISKPANGASRLVLLFGGRTEYLINCQSTPSRRAAVEQACTQALGSLATR